MLFDVQGYSAEELSFVFKEVSVLHFSHFEEINYKFLPPCKLDNLSVSTRESIDWLRTHHHGLSWSEGEIAYADLRSTLLSQVERYESRVSIYIKGAEKLTWIERLIGSDYDKYEFFELGELGCPSLKKLKKMYKVSKCTTHYGSFYSCTTENVQMLKEWLGSTHAEFLVS